ncbi:MAG: response regulator [Verrucomicrobiales bacterium]|nr:response regulator [Verrucomicrobiales bacterium]
MESRRPHIAIVENDDAFGAALVRLLKAGGFETVLFPSAEQFLENAHLDDLACVVLDVHLPGASGFELLSRLRRDLLKIPVLLMTADDSPATRKRALGSECMDFLIKPFEATVLLGTLRRCVLPPDPTPNQGL